MRQIKDEYKKQKQWNRATLLAEQEAEARKLSKNKKGKNKEK